LLGINLKSTGNQSNTRFAESIKLKIAIFNGYVFLLDSSIGL